MTTPEILRQAAKEVRCGWVKGERHDPYGVCALGGMENAAWFDDTSATNRQPPAEIICPGAVRALAQLVPSVSRNPIDVWNQGMSIGDWNDGIDQTAENVAATMELAAICFEQAHATPEPLAAVDPQVEVLESGTRAMKLSEAIRLGAMLHPQGFYVFIDPHDGATCALGAAAEAMHLDVSQQTYIPFFMRWPFTEHAITCPVCAGVLSDYVSTVADKIAHLNDDHEWTREQIADWVATIEPADEPCAQPETRAAVDPQVQVLESGTRA